MSSGQGKKRVKNLPVLHDEVKQKHTRLLTDTAWGKLQYAANNKGISISEIIEQLARMIDAD
jgi:hypothetical protein